MGIVEEGKPFPTPEEQEAAYKKQQKELAQERVERRERLGQKAQDEPALNE